MTVKIKTFSTCFDHKLFTFTHSFIENENSPIAHKSSAEAEQERDGADYKEPPKAYDRHEEHCTACSENTASREERSTRKNLLAFVRELECIPLVAPFYMYKQQ